MRKLFALALGAVFLLALAVPAAYFLLARDLPPLFTHDEILHTLKIYVEGQRQKEFAGVDAKMVEPFEPMRQQDLAPALLSGALAVQGCPDYFTTEKETGAAWLLRVVQFGLGMGFGAAGPGNCEIQFADRLAGALGLPTDAHRAVVVQELHNGLSKRELLQLELSCRYFAPGILGVRSASRRLMGKEPRALSVAEAAELLLAERDYAKVFDCRNPTLLRIDRNNAIEQMAAFKLISRSEAEAAKRQALHCLSRPG
jgi:hypothetical protein